MEPCAPFLPGFAVASRIGEPRIDGFRDKLAPAGALVAVASGVGSGDFAPGEPTRLLIEVTFPSCSTTVSAAPPSIRSPQLALHVR